MKARAGLLFGVAFLLCTPPFAAAQTAKPVCNLSANPSVVQLGGTSNLSWASTNADSGTITSIGEVGPRGIQGVIPTKTTTYVGTFTGPGGTGQCSVVMTVSVGTGINGGGTGGQGGAGTTGGTEGDTLDSGTGGGQGGSGGQPSTGILPTFSQTQTGATQGSNSAGLVPCSGLDCELCHVASLVQKLINFFIGLSIPIAVGLFAFAGFLLFSSGANPSQREKAKKVFQGGLIGFLIAITAWLVVQTLLKATLSNNYYQGWNVIQCTTQPRQTAGTIGGLLNSILGTPNTTPVPVITTTQLSPITFAYSCDSGFALVGSSCVSNSDPTNVVQAYSNPTGLSPTRTDSSLAGALANTQQWSAQLASACAQEGLYDCQMAQAIMAMESSGRPTVISSAGCVGLMQVCPGTARGLDPTLASLSNAQITQLLVSDPAYNMTLGVRYLAQLQSQFNDTNLVVAAYNGGPKANTPSSTCPGLTYWQCTSNSGYAETRAYVPNVVATRNLLLK